LPATGDASGLIFFLGCIILAVGVGLVFGSWRRP
jgi:LPXTG-motif cell wall-anchored protein